MFWRRVGWACVLTGAYVALGQLVRYIPNPMVPGAVIAINMVLVVIAGIVLGPLAGAVVGLLGTAVNGYLTPVGNPFERAAVVPHAVMGLAAGLAARRSVFTGALAVLVGHGLNVLMFLARGLMTRAEASTAVFFSGLLFEFVVDVVVVLFAVPLLRPLMTGPPAAPDGRPSGPAAGRSSSAPSP